MLQMYWFLIRRYLWLIILIYSPFAIAMFRIFKRAGRPGWWGIIPILNVFLLWPIAGQKHLLKFTLMSWALGIVFAFFGINILSFLCSLGTMVFLFIMNYSLAQNFGWKKSASCLFALSTGIGYFVLGFFNDEYIGYKGEAHFQNKSVDNNSIYLDNSVGFTQDEPEPIINPVNPNPYNEVKNPYDIVKPNINPVVNDGGNTVNGVNNSGTNNTPGVNDVAGSNNMSVEDFTPIGSMERPGNDGVL